MPAGRERLAVALGRLAVPVEVPVLQLDPGPPGPPGRNSTSTSLARAGSGTGTRSGPICQAKTSRRGGSQVSTRPQSARKPYGPIS